VNGENGNSVGEFPGWHEIKRILTHQKRGRQMFYKVLWQDESISWVPESNVTAVATNRVRGYHAVSKLRLERNDDRGQDDNSLRFFAHFIILFYIFYSKLRSQNLFIFCFNLCKYQTRHLLVRRVYSDSRTQLLTPDIKTL